MIKHFLIISCFIAAPLFGQNDSTGLPGDHFDLAGALELFSKSDSPEAFEKVINSETGDQTINNLDLNEDGEVDYIRIVDHVDGFNHSIVLQAVLGENESQDVAAIEIEKIKEGEANLQIVGDEDLYGKEYYVEPNDAVNPNGAEGKLISFNRVVLNVWLWPSVRFIYAPGYVVYVSPWRYRHYPVWWRPWRPVAWRVHYNRCRPFYRHHRVVHVHRTVHAHRVTVVHRTTSPRVRTRYAAYHQRHQQRTQQHSGQRHTPAQTQQRKAGNKGQQGTPRAGKQGGKAKPAGNGAKPRGGRR